MPNQSVRSNHVRLLFSTLLLSPPGACSSAAEPHAMDESDGADERDGASDEKDASSPAAREDDTAPGARTDAGSSQAKRDAAVADARTADEDEAAAAPDRPGDAGADAATEPTSSACGAEGLLFCEDFEQQELGALEASARFEPVSNMATLMVDDSRARGQKSLHIATRENGFGYLSVSDFAPPDNSFFGRMRVFIDALPSAPNYAHYTLVEAAGMSSDRIRPIGGQYIEGQGNLLGPGSDGGPTGDWTNWKPSAPFEARKWVCFEWQFDANDNAIHVWIDGAAKPDLSVSTEQHGGADVDFVFPAFRSVWFGWWLYQGGPTPDHYDLWIDDLALGTKQIGCERGFSVGLLTSPAVRSPAASLPLNRRAQSRVQSIDCRLHTTDLSSGYEDERQRRRRKPSGAGERPHA